MDFFLSTVAEFIVDIFLSVYKRFNPSLNEKEKKRIAGIISYILIFILLGSIVGLTFWYA